MGRHSAPDEDEENEDSAAPVAVPHEAAGSSGSGGAADLRLLRENPSLRARCAAAVIVPFALYTVVMIVVGRIGLYLLWVWIPTVLAGILVGAFLDRAHNSQTAAEREAQSD